MDEAVQSVVVEAVRTLWASGLWWAALALVLAWAVTRVAKRKGWILGPDSPLLPTRLPPDPVEHPPSPPMDMPEGGMQVPPPTRQEGDP